ncbi:hypothetical protein GW793_02080 [bacterium]|uniref:SGNH hydrolase-type esterase domain-containing protein n=2 Tax=Katanobacteria TaxID=422282 RepID=A0A2M7X2M0_UNCKA|nr:hypothetical protein [bacterium]PIP56104.1 MAG: hypothetical protein COX05_04870 [candidate division WWE3 bacterium CG22_combo_CG10-13_8_21_14_all_39_12]PJA40378.1 MAG: hypothetical protein CO179_02470 [candidate division WWE3 bacterium CG_4_9_14_3_um_filter_39_7]
METKPVKIAFWGSSSVYGESDPEGGYVGRFRNWYEDEYEGGSVYNLGVPGEISTQVLERFPMEYEHRQPDVCVFQMGANDSFRDGGPDIKPQVSLETFVENFEKIIKIINGRSKIFFILRFPMVENNPYKTADDKYDGFFFVNDIEKYVNALRDVATRHNIPYLDLWHEWKENERFRDFLDEDIGIHLNEAGHAYVANRLTEVLPLLFS